MKRIVFDCAMSRLIASSLLLALTVSLALPAYADQAATIARVKASVVAVGTFVRTRTPPFQFLGTGFAVDDGTLIVTNAHVLPALVDPAKMEVLAILVVAPDKDGKAQVREAKQIAVDPGSDLAVLRIAAPALPALKLRGSDGVTTRPIGLSGVHLWPFAP